MLIGVLFLSMAFAGCTDDGAEGGDDDAGDGDTPAPSRTAPKGGSRELVAGSKPLWFPGLQWTYEIEHPGRGVKGDVTLAVVSDDAEVWQVAPTEGSDPDALMWSLFTHLPPLGPISKATLSPFIHAVEVPWFDFPLEDGKTWQGSEHHGTQVNFTATAIDTTIFDGRKASAFEVIGERGGVTWLRYVYTAEVAWFSEAALDGDGDGQMDTLMTLKEAGVGTAHLDTPTFEPQVLAMVSDEGPQSITEPATGFTVPAGAEDLYVFFVLGGEVGRYTGSVTLPSGGVKSFNFTNTNQSFQVAVRGGHYTVGQGTGNVGTMILGQGFVFGEVFAVVRNGP